MLQCFWKAEGQPPQAYESWGMVRGVRQILLGETCLASWAAIGGFSLHRLYRAAWQAVKGLCRTNTLEQRHSIAYTSLQICKPAN